MTDQEMPQTERNARRLAKDILTTALDGSMPSSYWETDQRIARACVVLDIDPSFAEQATEESYSEWKGIEE